MTTALGIGIGIPFSTLQGAAAAPPLVRPRGSDAIGVEAIFEDFGALITLAPAWTVAIGDGNKLQLRAGFRLKDARDLTTLWSDASLNGLYYNGPQASGNANLLYAAGQQALGFTPPAGFIPTSRWELEIDVTRSGASYTVSMAIGGAACSPASRVYSAAEVGNLLAVANLLGVSSTVVAANGNAICYHHQVAEDSQAAAATTRLFVDEGAGSSTATEAGDTLQRTGTLGTLDVACRWRDNFTDFNWAQPALPETIFPDLVLAADNGLSTFSAAGAADLVRWMEAFPEDSTLQVRVVDGQPGFSGDLVLEALRPSDPDGDRVELHDFGAVGLNNSVEFKMPAGRSGLIFRTAGGLSGNARIYVNDISNVVAFEQQPLSQFIAIGNALTVSVQVNFKARPEEYQWIDPLGNISGATSSSYSDPTAAANDQGLYACRAGSSTWENTSGWAHIAMYTAGDEGVGVNLIADDYGTLSNPLPQPAVNETHSFSFRLQFMNRGDDHMLLQRAAQGVNKFEAVEIAADLRSARVNPVGGLGTYVNIVALGLTFTGFHDVFLHVLRTGASTFRYELEANGVRTLLADGIDLAPIFSQIGGGDGTASRQARADFSLAMFGQHQWEVPWFFPIDEGSGTVSSNREGGGTITWNRDDWFPGGAGFNQETEGGTMMTTEGGTQQTTEGG